MPRLIPCGAPTPRNTASKPCSFRPARVKSVPSFFFVLMVTPMAGDPVDLVRQDVAREAIGGDGLQQHAARLARRLEHRGLVAQARKEVRAGKARGAGADHRDLPLRVLAVANGIRELGSPSPGPPGTS